MVSRSTQPHPYPVVRIERGPRGAVQVITPAHITVQTGCNYTHDHRTQVGEGEEVPKVFRGRLGVDPETGKEWT